MNTLEGKKYTEIATELSISVNTVKTHVTKAYKIIREQLRNDESIAMLLLLIQSEDILTIKCRKFPKKTITLN